MSLLTAKGFNNFLFSKSSAFVVSFFIMLVSWILSFTSTAQISLAISSVCVLFLLFALSKASSENAVDTNVNEHSVENHPSSNGSLKDQGSVKSAVSEANNILSVTSSNIMDVFSTQNDAVSTLSESFISLQGL